MYITFVKQRNKFQGGCSHRDDLRVLKCYNILSKMLRLDITTTARGQHQSRLEKQVDESNRSSCFRKNKQLTCMFNRIQAFGCFFLLGLCMCLYNDAHDQNTVSEQASAIKKFVLNQISNHFVYFNFNLV